MSHDRIDWAAGKFLRDDPKHALMGYSYRIGRATRGKESDLLETQRTDALVEREGEAALLGDIAGSRYLQKRRLNGGAFKPWYDEALGCWRTDVPRPVTAEQSARQLHTSLQRLVQTAAQRRHR